MLLSNMRKKHWCHKPSHTTRWRSAVPLTEGQPGDWQEWKPHEVDWTNNEETEAEIPRVLSRNSVIKERQRNKVGRIGVKDGFLLLLALTSLSKIQRRREYSIINPRCHNLNSSSHFFYLVPHTFPTLHPQGYFEANPRHHFKERLFGA